MYKSTFQGSWFLCDADLPLGDHGFPLGVADVGRDKGQRNLLLFLRAREVQREQLPVHGLNTHPHTPTTMNT